MAYIRKLDSGRWQATVRLPDGKRRTASHATRGQARQWADITGIVARRLATATPGAEFAWSPAGLTIHIPEDLITMDTAAELERVLQQLFTAREA